MISRQLPKQWKEWELVQEIGYGSFSTVYLAEKKCGDTILKSAVKIIDVPHEENEFQHLMNEIRDPGYIKSYYKDLADEYMTEIRIMDRLKKCPYIVAFDDYLLEEKQDKIGWTIYIRMEYLRSYSSYYAEKWPGEADVLRMGIDICRALEFCEKEKIIHRDIKPDNIFITDQGSFKLGDFGTARQTAHTLGSMSAKGTYVFMAPEVFHGKKYGAAADIYSLGLVLYKLLNRNREPFLDVNKQIAYYKDREAAMNRRMQGEALPVPADASPETARVILKATAFLPSARYRSVFHFRRALEMALEAKEKAAFAKKDHASGNSRRGFLAAAVPAAIGAAAVCITVMNPNTKVVTKYIDLSGSPFTKSAAETNYSYGNAGQETEEPEKIESYIPVSGPSAEKTEYMAAYTSEMPDSMGTPKRLPAGRTAADLAVSDNPPGDQQEESGFEARNNLNGGVLNLLDAGDPGTGEQNMDVSETSYLADAALTDIVEQAGPYTSDAGQAFLRGNVEDYGASRVSEDYSETSYTVPPQLNNLEDNCAVAAYDCSTSAEEAPVIYNHTVSNNDKENPDSSKILETDRKEESGSTELSRKTGSVQLTVSSEINSPVDIRKGKASWAASDQIANVNQKNGKIRGNKPGKTVIRFETGKTEYRINVNVGKAKPLNTSLTREQAKKSVNGEGLYFVTKTVDDSEGRLVVDGYLVNKTGKNIKKLVRQKADVYVNGKRAAVSELFDEDIEIPGGAVISHSFVYDPGSYNESIKYDEAKEVSVNFSCLFET